MNPNWKPETLAKGDTVFAPFNPEWGIGSVLDAQRIGELKLYDGETYQLSPKSVGQRLSIKFSDGRTRTIISSGTKIQKTTNPD